jgi:hypothetical protein
LIGLRKHFQPGADGRAQGRVPRCQIEKRLHRITAEGEDVSSQLDPFLLGAAGEAIDHHRK